MARLSTVTDRNSLKPRRDPHWARISKGAYLGYRKMNAYSEGNWLARYLDETEGKQVYRALGDFSDLPDHQRYDAAKKAAEAWFEHMGKGGSAKDINLAEACQRYVDHLRETKGEASAKDAESRFSKYLYTNKRLSSTELTKLTPAHLANWRKHLSTLPNAGGARRGELRTDSTINRDMSSLRAALNLAYKDGWVTSDFAWRDKLTPIRNADRRRDVYLDLEQRRKLIEHAQDDLKPFIKGLCQIPLRPGALAALTVKSFDKRLRTITVGKDKAGQDRKIFLPDPLAEFFASLCKDKLPTAPLIARSNGKPWTKDAWTCPIKMAVNAAGLPSNATSYAIRHSVITDLIHDGLDTLTVAQLSGTSVVMIERHYGHLTREHAREALSRLTV
jgi:integrase